MSEEKTEKKRGRRLFILLLFMCVAAVAAFLAGISVGGRESKPAITSDLLGQQLRDAQDLVTVEYHYTNMGKFENQLDFYGWKVPFTGKSFIVSYDGVIKAGVDMSQLAVDVDENDRAIHVTLSDGKIISHEIPEDSIEVFDETRNIFNPITIQNYTDFTKDQKAVIEQRAIENGLLTSAEEKAKLAVESLLASSPELGEYRVEVK